MALSALIKKQGIYCEISEENVQPVKLFLNPFSNGFFRILTIICLNCSRSQKIHQKDQNNIAKKK